MNVFSYAHELVVTCHEYSDDACQQPNAAVDDAKSEGNRKKPLPEGNGS